MRKRQRAQSIVFPPVTEEEATDDDEDPITVEEATIQMLCELVQTSSLAAELLNNIIDDEPVALDILARVHADTTSSITSRLHRPYP